MREPFRLPIYAEPVLSLVPPVEPESPADPQPKEAPEPTFFAWLDEVYPEWAERPKTRGDCLKDERPCPWITCKYHLYIEVSGRGLKDVNLAAMRYTCVLDVADDGGLTLEEIGELFGVTRERIRQIEEQTLKKAKKAKSGILRGFTSE